MPFIEAYLLATALKSDVSAAKSYFDVNRANFDQFAFDIYAELGADGDIVTAITDALVSSVEELGVTEDQVPILFTDELQIEGLRGNDKLAELQKRLQKAVEDVISSRPNRERKQEILDVASKVEESARSEQKKVVQTSQGGFDAALLRLGKPFNVWAQAIILIGAGAERIEKEAKRRLAHEIVHATSVLMDELLRAFPRDLFKGLRERYRDDTQITKLLSGGVDPSAIDQIRGLVDALIDTYELALYTLPLRLPLGFLCDAAGLPVLSQTVASVVGTSKLDNLVAKIWAGEINARRAKGDLLAAIRDLPPAPLLRYGLYRHLMARVYWTQWEVANQLAMLDAADEALSPLQSRVSKGAVQRQVRTAAKAKERKQPKGLNPKS